MKVLYQFLYIFSVVLFVMAVFGGSVFKTMFDKVSMTTLEKAGIRESYVTQTDEKIDEMFYKMKRVELQIEKLKNFFSQDSIDESKYQKEKNELIRKNLYGPLVEMFNYMFRLGFIMLALIVFLAGGICHVVYRSIELRRRVNRLEQMLAAGNI